MKQKKPFGGYDIQYAGYRILTERFLVKSCF